MVHKVCYFCTLFQMGEWCNKLNELETRINVERDDIGGKYRTSVDPILSKFHDNDHHSSKTLQLKQPSQKGERKWWRLEKRERTLLCRPNYQKLRIIDLTYSSEDRDDCI